MATDQRARKNSALSKLLIVAVLIVTVAAIIISLFPSAGGSKTEEIWINEVMASNKSAVVDDSGQYSDWIELYNPSSRAINLEGWGLSDSKQQIAKWTFPSVELAPGQYMIIYCSKQDHRDKNAPLHTNFGLNSTREDVVLTNNLGTIVDFVTFSNMGSDMSLGREVGNPTSWVPFEKVTPGFSNDAAGHEAYLASLKATTTDLVITEVMSANATTLLDDYGIASDWVEIYNKGTAAINLKGYGLSDKSNKLMKWVFPDVSIAPGQYLLIYCSGKSRPQDPNDTGKLHTNFSLSNYQETVVLSSNRGQVLDSVTLPQLSSDSSYALDQSNGTWRITSKPTPGFPNTDDGYTQWNNTKAVKTGLMISEAMTYNDKYAPVNSTYYDWVELYNGSGASINLKGYGLTDDTQKPLKWKFPDVTIGAGEYLLIHCSGLSSQSTNPLHASFRLAATGETVALYNANSECIDAMGLGDIPTNMSMGRVVGQKGFFYFSTPTPKAVNGNGARGFAQTPAISLAAGSYRGAQQVSLSSAEAGTSLYYTTDGSTPTKSSTHYTGPIAITKTTALRAVAVKDDLLPSRPATATYLIDAPHTLPVVSLVTNPPNLFDANTGIYVLGANGVDNEATQYPGANFWKDWERDVHFEYIQEDGKLGVALDGGIKIFGAFSRMKAQKGFSIWARARYGTDTIKYPFFTTRPYTEYKAVVLRAGAQDSTQSKIRDIVITDLVRAHTTLDVAAYRQSVVYINGQYWGYYNIREKINKHMLAQHHNLADMENIDLIVGNSRALVGSNEDYKAMVAYATGHDMRDAAAYKRMTEWMDMENFIDWVICEAWTNNADLGNIKFWRERSTQGKWRWILYDFCWGMYNPEMDGIARMFNPAGMGAGNSVSTALLRALIQNDTFKELFLQRCKLHFNTTFAPDRVLAKINECVVAMEDEIGRDRARWNNGTAESWKKSQIAKMESFSKVRSSYMIYFVRKNLGLSEQKTIEIFGSAGVVPPTPAN